jgi:hypothetical protein
MQKIISLFKRDYEGTRQVYNEVVEGAEWVLNGEGRATLKIDGTCCLIKDGILYRRYDAKKGKTPPEGFISAQEPDPITGHWPGWIEVKKDNPSDKWHWEAFWGKGLQDGTYELIGPKIQGNPYGLTGHGLLRHGVDFIYDNPRTFDDIKNYLMTANIEGIVWHHDDGRMVKIKSKDFGIKWLWNPDSVPKVIKYYYDCPLKAALMIKSFNIQCYVIGENGDQCDFLFEITDYSYWEEIIFDAKKKDWKIYIHPDSEHIFTGEVILRYFYYPLKEYYHG